MITFFSVFSGILDNIYEILIGSIGAFIALKGLDPFFAQFYDAIRNHQGFWGNLYKFYSRTLGRKFFFKKKTMHVSLFKEGWEYRIYQIGDKVKCYESKMIRLDQNIFDRIEGEMLRTGIQDNNYSAYFKGYLRNSNNYLIWEERFKDGEFFHDLTTYYYLPQTTTTDLIGITSEYSTNYKGIINSLSVLTSKKNGYSTVKEILEIEDTKNYIQKLNIDIDCIDYECNQIINLKN